MSCSPENETDALPIDADTPIADYKPFQDYLAFIQLRNSVASEFFSRSSDATKLSAEFSKLIIVNLQFVNAGGLLAVPGLSSTFLGLSNLSRYEKMLYLGAPMAIFATGLITASLCAFFTYRNYQFIAHKMENIGVARGLEIERIIPRITRARLKEVEAGANDLRAERIKQTGRADLYYWLGLISGWVSVICFITACGWLAAVAK